jgi:hypothetical protein
MGACLFAAIAPLLAGCRGGGRASGNAYTGVPIYGTREELYRHFDSDVVIVGRAQTSKTEGAAVVIADGTRIRIPEMKSWPNKVEGKRVTVGGVLRRWPSQAPPEDAFTLQGARWSPGDTTFDAAARR